MPVRRTKLGHRRVEKDHVRTQGGAGHLEAEQSSLRRNSAAQHLDLGVWCWSSRTVRTWTSAVEAGQPSAYFVTIASANSSSLRSATLASPLPVRHRGLCPTPCPPGRASEVRHPGSSLLIPVACGQFWPPFPHFPKLQIQVSHPLATLWPIWLIRLLLKSPILEVINLFGPTGPSVFTSFPFTAKPPTAIIWENDCSLANILSLSVCLILSTAWQSSSPDDPE